jgi:hypothetical protein
MPWPFLLDPFGRSKAIVGWAKRSEPNILVAGVEHVAMLLCPTYETPPRFLLE